MRVLITVAILAFARKCWLLLLNLNFFTKFYYSNLVNICQCSGEPVNVALNNDPMLANLTHSVMEVYHSVKLVEKIFEENRQDSARLAKLVEEIKELNAVLQMLQIEISTEIATHPIRSFYNRFALEALLIETNGHRKFLVEVAKEILAEKAKVSSFAVYETSEMMIVARELMAARYLDMLKTMFEVDKLLVEAFKMPGATTVDQKTKQAIDEHFRKIITIDELTKAELTTDFYKEVERIRLEGKELNLEMKMEFHVGIDLQNFLRAYVTKYEELFLKIVHN